MKWQAVKKCKLTVKFQLTQFSDFKKGERIISQVAKCFSAYTFDTETNHGQTFGKAVYVSELKQFFRDNSVSLKGLKVKAQLVEKYVFLRLFY